MNIFDLQLFADESAETETAENNDAQDTEKSKAETKKTAEAKSNDGGKKYTDAEVDDLINRKFAEWQKKQQNAVDEAKKLAEMSAQERAEHERDELKKELDALKKQANLAEMTKTARKLLSDDGITVPDELLAMMVSDSADDTKAAISGFSTAFKSAVEVAVKERLRGEPPRRGNAGGTAPMTKEQIMKIKDTDLRQKKMLENKHLFNL